MENTFQINQQSTIVFDYLTDMQKFKSMHPGIRKIDDLGNDNYLVQETLKFGPIPFSFRYPLTIKSNRERHEITKHAIVKKIFRLEIGYRMIPTVDFTIVEETITFKGFLPIQSLMENAFRKPHVVLFQKVNDLPED